MRVLALIIFLFAVTPYFLEDFLEVRYEFDGSYFWLMALGVSFFAGVFYFSQFLLPLPWQSSWYEAVRLTIRLNFPFLIEIARWFFIRPRNIGVTLEAMKDLPPSFAKHKAGIIRSHHAPVIFRGASYIRGAGPGFLRLKQGEIITQVIDLRRHFRRMPVRVLTRDGIMLESSVSTIFQIQHQEDPPDDNLQFPFDQEAIFKVNYLGNFKSEDDVMLPWSERVCRQAASALISEVSRYSLDELFQPDESRAAPLEHIKGRITKQMSRTFEKYGIQIILVGVTPFQVPDDIKEERVAIWQAEWERRIEVEQGTAQAERARRLKLARARAQIEMIEKLTDGLETIHEAGQEVTDILALRLIEAIEEAQADANVRALIPGQIVDDLQSIRNQVLGEKD
jgi:regulator of protease activity HflC (stomatin/prohibitin superfamily)